MQNTDSLRKWETEKSQKTKSPSQSRGLATAARGKIGVFVAVVGDERRGRIDKRRDNCVDNLEKKIGS